MRNKEPYYHIISAPAGVTDLPDGILMSDAVNVSQLNDAIGNIPLLTFDNGLTRTLNNVRLGGEFVDNIVIGGFGTTAVLQLTTSGIISLYNQNITGSIGVDNTQVSMAFTTGPSSAVNLRLTSTGDMLVTDTQNFKGLGESADYSANKTAFSYVTKQMLENSSVTADNGLTKTGNNITLGGDYISTILVGDFATKGSLFLDSSGFGLFGNSISQNDSASILYSGGNLELQYLSEGLVSSLTFYNENQGGIVFRDFISQKGAGDLADYSANKTDWSYITKKWALDTFGVGSNLTFDNGLTRTLNNVQLGGDYTDNIIIGNLSDTKALAYLADTGFILSHNGYSAPLSSLLVLQQNSVLLSAFASNPSNNVSLILNSSDTKKAVIKDTVDSKGLYYESNYSTNWVNGVDDLVLVNRKWVQDNFAGSDLSAYQLRSEKGQPLGYASLDSSGKIVITQIPDTILGALKWGGSYDGSTVTASAVFPELNGQPLPTAADYEGVFFLSTADYTEGGIDFTTGDWIISINTSWNKVDNSDAVMSVNGMIGNVTVDDVPKWHGLTYDGTSSILTPAYLMSSNGSGIFGYSTKEDVSVGSAASVTTNAGNLSFLYSDDGTSPMYVWGNKGATLESAKVFQTANLNVRSATLWNSQPFFGGLNTNPSTVMAYDASNNVWSPTNQSQINAGSATLWGGREADLSAVNNIFDYVLVRNTDGITRLSDKSGFKSGLATSLQDVTSVSGLTNNFLKITGQNNVLNGDGLEIFRNTDPVVGSVINSYDRGGTNTFRPLQLSASEFAFNNGNVGIKLSGSPTEALDVNGNIKSSGIISWGPGSGTSGGGQIFSAFSLGTVLIPTAGSIYDFYLTSAASGAPAVMTIPTGTVNVQLPSLAGTGDRPIFADSAGTLKIGSGLTANPSAFTSGRIPYTTGANTLADISTLLFNSTTGIVTSNGLTVATTTKAAGTSSLGATPNFTVNRANGGDNNASSGFALAGTGGDIAMRSGNGGGSVTSSGTKVGGNGGRIDLIAGDAGIAPAGTSGTAGDATLQAGTIPLGAGTPPRAAGDVFIKGGVNQIASGFGGSIYLVPGYGSNNTGPTANLTYDGNTFLGANVNGSLRGAVIVGSNLSDGVNTFQVTGDSRFYGDITSNNFFLYNTLVSDYTFVTTDVGTATHKSTGLSFKKVATDGISNTADINIAVNANATTPTTINLQLPNANGTLATINDIGTGWAVYNDTTYTSGSPFVINSGVTSTLPNDAGTTLNSQLPLGVTSFYDSSTSKITPQNDGDYYITTIRFKATTTAPTAGYLDFGIDIGGALGVQFKETKIFAKGAAIEHQFSITVPMYSASTFIANGGLVKLTAGNGNISVYEISFHIDRTHKAR